MRTIDFTPLHRFAVGFDRMQRQFDHAMQVDDAQSSYPPYNIEALRAEDGADKYRITMAVAGFGEEDLAIELKEDTLFVSGKADKPEQEVQYLHHGIAGRAFERRFELADHIKVLSASLENGMLHIELAREVPEEKKPRRINIEPASKAKGIENKAA
ncbi:MAG: Hsp20 family protein [Rhodospirillaceae bacterium]|nr:Hsp20 family protein [Rhodospirillaceae bacterium]MBL6941774.1 Hsp20 family protein [Rhodospirillales bacterium]